MIQAATPAPVVDAILDFNRGRKRKLLAVKWQRMDHSPFAFFRGTDDLFARSWPGLRPADPGPAVWICGDLHLENFGAYRAEDGGFRFDINDFDEALVAPCGLDLVRCATSILLAAREWQLPPAQGREMAEAFLDQYRTAVQDAARLGLLGEVTLGTGRGPIWDLLGKTAAGSQVKLLDHHTEVSPSGKRRIRRDDKHPELPGRPAGRVRKAVERYGRDRPDPKAYRVLDVTGRVVGVGSLGLRRYLVLTRGGGPEDMNRLLDVKEAAPSALRGCTDEPQPDAGTNEARRVVRAQRQLQARPAAGLDALKVGGRWCRVREMVPEENRSGLDRLQKKPDKLRRAVEMAGRITGWSEARGCQVGAEDRTADLARWTTQANLSEVLAAASRFFDQVQFDYQEFHRARAAGRLAAGAKDGAS